MELLVTLSAPAADRASAPRHGHRLHVDLDSATVEQVVQHALEEFDSIDVIVSTWSELRRAALPLRLLGSTKSLRIRVLAEPVPNVLLPAVWPGIAGRLLEFTCKSAADDGTTIRLRLSRPSPLHHLVGFLVTRPSVLAAPLRVALTSRDLEPFFVGNSSVRYAGADDTVDAGGVSVARTEALVAAATPQEPAGSVDVGAGDPRPCLRLAPPASDAARASSDAAVCFPPVDTAVVNPVGFAHRNQQVVGRVTAAPGGGSLIAAADGQPMLLVPPHGALDAGGVNLLRDVKYLSVAGERDDVVAEASLLCQLAAAGVPLVASGLHPQTRDLLGSALADALCSIGPEDLEDPVLREAASIRLRRSALRSHGLGPRQRQIAARLRHPVAEEPAVSIVLMTRRPHRLASALEQVRRQTYPNLQLVLGVHGDGFDDGTVAAALDDLPMPSLVVPVAGDVAFGEALNRASARCDGRLITKWDDDDLYGTEHVWDLVLAADYSGASVVGKGAEFTLVSEADTTVRRSGRGGERFTHHVAGGTILLRRESLQELGGWRPQPRYVDDALLRQVLDAGGTVYRTHGFGYLLVRHNEGHTWDPGPAYFLRGEAPRWTADARLQQVALEQTW